MVDHEHAWHANDCGGWPACSGCGYIGRDGLWYAGPAPEHPGDLIDLDNVLSAMALVNDDEAIGRILATYHVEYRAP